MRQKISCVYKLYFDEHPDKIYIGSTCDFKRRFNEHCKKLLNETHENKFLQKDFRKYGMISLKYDIIHNQQKNETRDDLYKKETDYIIKYESNINGYNISLVSNIKKDFKIEIENYDYSSIIKFIKNFSQTYKVNLIKSENRFLQSLDLRLTKFNFISKTEEEKTKLLKSFYSEIKNRLGFKNTAFLMDNFTKEFEGFQNTMVYKKLLGSNLKTNEKNYKKVKNILVGEEVKPFVKDTPFLKEENVNLYALFTLFRKLNDMNLEEEINIILSGRVYTNLIGIYNEVINSD